MWWEIQSSCIKFIAMHVYDIVNCQMEYGDDFFLSFRLWYFVLTKQPITPAWAPQISTLNLANPNVSHFQCSMLMFECIFSNEFTDDRIRICKLQDERLNSESFRLKEMREKRVFWYERRYPQLIHVGILVNISTMDHIHVRTDCTIAPTWNAILCGMYQKCGETCKLELIQRIIFECKNQRASQLL